MSRRHSNYPKRSTHSATKFVILFLAVCGCALLWRHYFPRRSQAKTNQPPFSIVLLLHQPQNQDEKTISQMTRLAWGDRLAPSPHDIQIVEKNGARSFVFHAGGHAFAINLGQSPYFDDAQKEARGFNDPLLATVVSEHQGWVSVDVLDRAEAISSDDAYRWIGKLAAQLANADCGAVYVPQIARISLCNADLKAILCSENPLQAVGVASTVQVAEDDPKLKAAELEARKRWPEFIDAFGHRAGGQSFQIKAPFVEGSDVEYLWLTVNTIDTDTIQANVEDAPELLKNVHAGDVVKVKTAAISDWLYTKGEQTFGDFSSAALKGRQ